MCGVERTGECQAPRVGGTWLCAFPRFCRGHRSLSSVLSKPGGALEGVGSTGRGGGALLSEIPFFALQFLSVMWQGMGGCVGWAVSNVSQDWAEVRATEA